ncbi:MAG: hypothetical protein JWM79_175, partial [Nocardioides sp.]|nr:hypothetical protein [Nocardioides sp.]
DAGAGDAGDAAQTQGASDQNVTP